MELNLNNLTISHNDLIQELKYNNIKFIVTYNKAGKFYGWGGIHPTLDIIVDNTLPNLLNLSRILNLPKNKIKELRKGNTVSLINELNQKILTIWTVIGYRNFKDFTFNEFDGYKIISKRDLIDTIKYNPEHIELRAKLALEEDILKDDNILIAFYKSVKG